MPRRTIDPEFFTNEKIGQLPHSWRLMILGLILKAADDQGRATANPALLVFTPANIKAGIDVARFLPLQEIGTRFDDEGKDLTPPAAFGEAFDAATPPAK